MVKKVATTDFSAPGSEANSLGFKYDSLSPEVIDLQDSMGSGAAAALPRTKLCQKPEHVSDGFI